MEKYGLRKINKGGIYNSAIRARQHRIVLYIQGSVPRTGLYFLLQGKAKQGKGVVFPTLT